MAINSTEASINTASSLTPVSPFTTDNTTAFNSSFNDSSNATESSSYFERNEELAKVEIALLSTILYLALFGNILVLVVLRLRRQKLTRMKWFIIHLSLADIFVAIFHILPQLLMDVTNQFYGGDFICRAVKYLSVVAMYASSYVLVMTAVDRYVSICHPLVNQTLSPKRTHLMILLAWGLSLLFSTPQIFIFSLHDMGDGYECYAVFDPLWGLKAWVTWVFLSVYAIPFLLLAFCYTRICYVVWISVDSRQAGYGSTFGSRDSRSSSKGFLWRSSFRPSSSTGARNDNSSVRLGSLGTNGVARLEDAQSLRCLTSSNSKTRGQVQGHQRGMSNAKVKTVKMTLTVVLCYLLCWAPWFFVNMLTVWDESVAFQGPVFAIIALLASLNSCTNPWIYLAFSGRTCCTPGSGRTQRRISRSWTRSTDVVTASCHDQERRGCRSSIYDLSRCGGGSVGGGGDGSRGSDPWTRGTLRTSSSNC